jgi:hypothetical protein
VAEDKFEEIRDLEGHGGKLGYYSHCVGDY